MTLDLGVANLELARALADQLATSGVHHAVICPGSRSTPIAVSLASQPDIQTWVLVDERAAGFFALVWRGSPPHRFLQYSGTAAANFLPAVARRGECIPLSPDRRPAAEQ
jgi:2-succinyl-5-enolpyruvyl-6-hydroxy-3-cyclohexene-1-carboxylate synthase